jgi:hypothetical protein
MFKDGNRFTMSYTLIPQLPMAKKTTLCARASHVQDAFFVPLIDLNVMFCQISGTTIHTRPIRQIPTVILARGHGMQTPGFTEFM